MSVPLIWRRKRPKRLPEIEVLFENPGCVIFPVQFPLDPRSAAAEAPQYETQTQIRVPGRLAIELGLDPLWGFRLQRPDQLAFFAPVDRSRPAEARLPQLEVFWPDMLLHQRRFGVQGGMAIALLDLPDEIDLVSRRGSITMMLTEVELLDPPPHWSTNKSGTN